MVFNIMQRTTLYIVLYSNLMTDEIYFNLKCINYIRLQVFVEHRELKWITLYYNGLPILNIIPNYILCRKSCK